MPDRKSLVRLQKVGFDIRTGEVSWPNMEMTKIKRKGGSYQAKSCITGISPVLVLNSFKIYFHYKHKMKEYLQHTFIIGIDTKCRSISTKFAGAQSWWHS